MLKKKLSDPDALRAEYGGTTLRVYVRKRPTIDWPAIRDERLQGTTAAALALRLGVSERTVIRRAPVSGGRK